MALLPYGRRGMRETEPARAANASCGHVQHVGTCPSCQRRAQQRQRDLLAAAEVARQGWLR